MHIRTHVYDNKLLIHIIIHTQDDRTQTPDSTIGRVIINFTDDDKH
jgi:hypothetical protein